MTAGKQTLGVLVRVVFGLPFLFDNTLPLLWLTCYAYSNYNR